MFVSEDGEVATFNLAALRGRTTEELVRLLMPDRVGRSVLGIRTDLYQMRLEPGERPLETHPELEKDAQFVALPMKENGIWIFVEICCEIELPPVGVRFSGKQRKGTLSDVITAIRNTLSLPISDVSLAFGENTVTQGDAASIIARAMKKRLQVRCKVGSEVKELDQMRESVLEDLVAAERMHVRDLERIVEFWKPMCVEKEMFKADEDVFHGVVPLLKVHKEFLEEIEKSKGGLAALCGRAFLKFSHDCSVAKKYVSRFPRVAEMLDEKEGNEEMKKMVKECGGRDLVSFLVMPVQTLPKYTGYLSHLIEATPMFHPDLAPLRHAYREMWNMTKSINRESQITRNRNVMRRLHKLFHGSFYPIANGRKLLNKMNVEILKPDHVGGVFYLFNNLLVLARVDGDERQTVIFHAIKWNLRYERYRDALDCVSWYSDNEFVVTRFQSILAKDEFLQRCQCLLARDNNLFEWRDVQMNRVTPMMKRHEIASVNNEMFVVMKNKLYLFKLDIGDFEESVLPFGKIRGHSMVSVGNCLYVFGGKTQDFFDKTAVLDVTSHSWEIRDNSFPIREKQSASVWDNKIVVFGGRNERNEYLNDILILDTTKPDAIWQKIDSQFPVTPRIDHSAVIFNDKLYVHGGRNGTEILRDLKVLNLRKMVWRDVRIGGVPLIPRCQHSAVVIGNHMMVFGGNCSTLQPFYIDLLSHIVRPASLGGNYPPSLVNAKLLKTEQGCFLSIGGSVKHPKATLNRLSYVMVPATVIGLDPSGLSGTVCGVGKPCIVSPRRRQSEDEVVFDFSEPVTFQMGMIGFFIFCFLMVASSNSKIVSRIVIGLTICGTLYLWVKRRNEIKEKAIALAKVIKSELAARQLIQIESFKRRHDVAVQVWDVFLSWNACTKEFKLGQRDFGDGNVDTIEINRN